MAAVKVVLNGVIVDMYGRVITGPVKIMGELMFADRGVGGGPMPPGEGGGDKPDHIWGGGNEPFPTPPIHLPPGSERPPGTWGGAGEPFPTPPIVIPPDFLPPDVTIPEGHVLVIVYDPATKQYKASTMPKPGPGYTPPSGGSTPQPV